MADNLGVKISTVVDVKLAEKQLDAFIKKYDGKKISFGIDSNAVKLAENSIKATTAEAKLLTAQSKVHTAEVKSATLEYKKQQDLIKATNQLKSATKSNSSKEMTTNNAEWKQLETQMKSINNADWSNLKSQLQTQKSEVAANNAEWKKLEATMTQTNNFDYNSNKTVAQQSASLTKLTNQAQTLQNTMSKLGSSSDTGLVFKKNPELANQFNALNSQLTDYTGKLKAGAISQEEFNKQNFGQKVKNIGSDIQVASNKMDGFTKTILSNISAFAQWFLIGGLVSGVTRSIKSGISTIIELDNQMVELKKVTDETDATYAKFYIESNNVAKALGVTTSAVMGSTAQWAQMGFTISEASKLAENSALLSNISENMSIEDSTSTIISTIKAFGLSTDDVLDGVISKINQVGKNVAYIYGNIYAFKLSVA